MNQNLLILPKHVIESVIQNLDPISFLRFSIINKHFFSLCTNMHYICYNNICILLGNTSEWDKNNNKWDTLAAIANGDQIAQFIYDALPKINSTIIENPCYCWGYSRNEPCYVTYYLEELCTKTKLWFIEWLYVNKNYQWVNENISFDVELFYAYEENQSSDLYLCIEYGINHASFPITSMILYELLSNMILIQPNKQIRITIHQCLKMIPDWNKYWIQSIIPRLSFITQKLIQSSLILSTKY